MATNQKSYVGRLYRFKCKCGGGGCMHSGCGLVSDGALLRAVQEPANQSTEMEVVMGWYRGDPGAPAGQFCALADSDEDWNYWQGLGNSRHVYVHNDFLIPLEDEHDN